MHVNAANVTWTHCTHYCSYGRMESCWRQSPKERLTFSKINRSLVVSSSRVTTTTTYPCWSCVRCPLTLVLILWRKKELRRMLLRERMLILLAPLARTTIHRLYIHPIVLAHINFISHMYSLLCSKWVLDTYVYSYIHMHLLWVYSWLHPTPFPICPLYQPGHQMAYAYSVRCLQTYMYMYTTCALVF